MKQTARRFEIVDQAATGAPFSGLKTVEYNRSLELLELSAVVGRIYFQNLRAAKSYLSGISPSPLCRKFVVNRMGSTGSTWLAKLLNSHPDIYCSHEGVVSRVYPAKTYCEDDILRFVDSLAAETAHGAYAAIGDVGSVWTGHAACLSSFTTAILMRHPARMLHTRLRVYPKDQSFSEIPAESARILREFWGLDLRVYEPTDQIFLHDLVVFASQVWAMGKIDLLMRIEDLRCLDRCARALRALTGVHFPQRLILNANRSRVNQRTGMSQPIPEIVASFSQRQRDWYGTLLADAVPFFGYDLWSDDRAEPPLPHALSNISTSAPGIVGPTELSEMTPATISA